LDPVNVLGIPARIVVTHNRPRVEHATVKALCALAIAIAVTMCALVACSSSTPPPPKPLGTPKSVDDITGIWRSVHQNTLEFRKNGTFVLITVVSDAMAGDYTLTQDKITFFDTKGCGATQGTYRIQVSPKGRMELSEPDDTCPPRKLALADPFVYAQPDFS
jgi:hypothetical protein